MLEWKPLVKMKMVVDLSLGIKVWDTLLYLPRESDVGASWVFLVTTLEFMGGGSIVSLEGSCIGARHGLCCSAWSLVARNDLRIVCLLQVM